MRESHKDVSSRTRIEMAHFVSLCVLALLPLIIYYNLVRRRVQIPSGFQPPREYPHIEPLLELDLLLKTLKRIIQHNNIPAVAESHKIYGSTFKVISLGTQAFYTIQPDNLKAIYGTKWTDWGVEPARLEAMEPFCGRGFITTDGESWQRMRAMLTPSFAEPDGIDLISLGIALDEFLQKIPVDGTTVDLAPMLYELFPRYVWGVFSRSKT